MKMIYAYFTHQIQRVDKTAIHEQIPSYQNKQTHNMIFSWQYVFQWNVSLLKTVPSNTDQYTVIFSTIQQVVTAKQNMPKCKNQLQKESKYTLWSHAHYSILDSCYNMQNSWQSSTLLWLSPSSNIVILNI